MVRTSVILRVADISGVNFTNISNIIREHRTEHISVSDYNDLLLYKQLTC